MLSRNYNDVNIRQREDGFLDATAMAKACGKTLENWWRQESTFRLFNGLMRRLAKKQGVAFHPVDLQDGDASKLSATKYAKLFPGSVEVKRARPDQGGGTWLHPKLAIQLAQWLDEDFALDVSDWVEELLTKGSVTYADSSPDLGVAIANRFIQDKARKWELHFDAIWQEESCRVTGYGWKNDIRMAQFIWKSIYCYFPQEVRHKLLTVNSERKARHHQFFTQDADENALRRHIDKVCGLLIASKNKTQFWQNYTNAFGEGMQLELEGLEVE